MSIALKNCRQVVIELLRLVPIGRTAWKDLMMDGAFPVGKKLLSTSTIEWSLKQTVQTLMLWPSN